MTGKAYDKTKASALHKKMESAFENIPKEDAYLTQLSAAQKSLVAYVGGRAKTIDIPSASLHGLGSIGLGGLDLAASYPEVVRV